MNLLTYFFIGVGLAMDAFAVSICKGLSMPKINYKNGFIIALFFGVFQAVMPFIGWLLGSSFARYIESIDHWVAFILLAFVGGKMIFDVVRGDEDDEVSEFVKIDYKELLMLAVATSIDALAVGISFALLDVNIFQAIAIIGVMTFVISFAGVIIGNFFGSKFEKPAQLIGGIILCIIGIKILLEHLGILA